MARLILLIGCIVSMNHIRGQEIARKTNCYCAWFPDGTGEHHARTLVDFLQRSRLLKVVYDRWQYTGVFSIARNEWGLCFRA